MNELEILISADLNVNQSIPSINKSIEKLEKKIDKLKLQATLDNGKSKAEIQKQIETLNKQKKKLYVDLQLRKGTLKKQYQELQKESNLTLNVNTVNAQRQIKNMSSVMGGTKSETVGLGLALKNAFSNAGLAISAQSALQLVRKAANEATQAVKEYDQYATNLSIITGGSRENSNKVIGDLAEKSLNFKVDISDLEGAAETILRTGKSIDETNKYLENTVYLSKLGFQDMDTSASQLVTIGNAYGYTADEMSAVVDKFTKLDTSANITAGKLAEGVAKSAQNANLAGFSIDQLSASIAGLKDTTGNTESQIANSLNMIFSRLQNVKLGKFIIESEDGTEDITQAINDTEKLLNTFNIKLRDSKNEFRDIGELFTELSDNWSKFNSVQQSAIATTIAGARQRNTFIALIENWNKIQELTDVSLNSIGTSVQKYDSYLNSIEAKSAKFSTATKELWNNLLPTDFVGNMTSAGTAVVQFTDKYQILQTALKSAVFYGLAKGAIAAKNSFSGMVTDIKNVSTAFTQLEAVQKSSIGTAEYANNISALGKTIGTLSDKQAKLILSTKSLSDIQKLEILRATGLEEAEAKAKLQTLGLSQANDTATVSTFKFSGAVKALLGVIAANPIVALTMAFTAVSTIISTVQRKQEEYRQSVKDTAKETKEFTDELNSLYDAYTDMKTGVENGTASKEDLTEATNKLLEALGYESGAVDDLISKYGDLHTAISQAAADRLNESLPDLANAVNVEFDELIHKSNIQASMSFTIDKNDANKKITDFLNDFTSKNNTEFIKVSNRVYNEYSAPYTTDIGKEYSFVEIFNNDIDNSVDGIKKRLDELNLLKQELFNYFGAEDVQNVGLYKTVNNQIANLQESYKEYTTALSDYNNTAAKAQIIQSLVGREIPKTVEEYKKYRSELIKSANDSKEYIGSQEDITNSIDGTLSKMNEFADVQNRLNNLETAKDKFVVGKVNSKSISDFINSLSDDDLSILIQLDTNIFDNGLDGAEQAIEDFKNNPNNKITVDVETGDTSSLDDLEKSYDELSKSADSFTKSQKSLTDALKEQKEHGQLSADTIKSLSEAGYSQALAVDKETGAVTLNVKEYERLNEQKKQKIKLGLEQQNTELETKLKEEESAISSLKLEYEALAKANKEANSERLKAIEIELAQHSQNKAKLQDLVNKNNSVSISLDAPIFDTSSTKTDAWKEEAEEKIANIKHLYEMEQITYASYLSQLDKLNEKYFANDKKYLDDFRKYEEEIYKGRKKLNEDLIAEQEKSQKAYHDKRISELETQITVTTQNSVDDQGNKLTASEKFNYIRSIYDEILSEIERRENEIVQSGVEGHENELAELAKQYESYANKKADIFNDEIQQEMDYISNLEKKYNDFVDKRIKHYENERDIIKDRYDSEIKSIDDTIDALKDKNDAASKSIELKKAEQNLENAKQRTRKVYGSDGRITYEQDTDKIAEAQQRVDDLKLDMLIDNLEKQKEAKENEKDAALEKYDNMITVLNEQKEKQSIYYDSLLEILNSYLNPNATENLDTVFERIFADKDNVKVENGTTTVNGNTIDTSNIDKGKLDGDKVNKQIEQTSNYETFMKLLYNMAGKEPDAYERYKRGEYDEGNKLMRDIFSDDVFINRAKKPFEDAITSFNETITKSSITNIEKQQPVNVTFSGGINIQNPVGEVEQFAKELMLQLPTAFNRQIYTNLKY